MNGNSFDSIAQAILQQKQMMDELQTENRELRRQLADLRAGYGIFIEIEGKRFPLKGEIVSPRAVVASISQQDFPSSSTPPLQEMNISPVNAYEAVKEVASTRELSPLAEAPEEVVQEEAKTPVVTEKVEQEKVPTFLEEIMIDEFATASTSPLSVWEGPVQKKEQEQINEEQKAALRRELMGSFLLE